MYVIYWQVVNGFVVSAIHGEAVDDFVSLASEPSECEWIVPGTYVEE